MITGSPADGVVRAWALVSGLQRVDVALDGRSGAVRTFPKRQSADIEYPMSIVVGYRFMRGSVTSAFLYMLFR